MSRLIVFLALLVLSCSKDSPSPTEPAAAVSAEEAAGPWQTVSINGVLYRRVAAKPTETSQRTCSSPSRLATKRPQTGRSAFPIRSRSPAAPTRPTAVQTVANLMGATMWETRRRLHPASRCSIRRLAQTRQKSFWSPASVSESHELTQGDTDYFRLNVTRRVYLGVASGGPTDVVGQLLDENGVVLDSEDNNRTDDNNNFLLFFPS